MPDNHCCCGPTTDPRCNLCLDPGPTRYFFTASGAILDCSLNLDCTCPDGNGGHIDATIHTNGSWSADYRGDAKCPFVTFGDAAFPCFATAGSFDATISWVVQLLTRPSGNVAWQAGLNLNLPGNPSAATILWRTAESVPPIDCGQTVSGFAIVQSTLDAYNAKTTNAFSQQVYIYGTNHMDLSNMSLVLHT